MSATGPAERRTPGAGGAPPTRGDRRWPILAAIVVVLLVAAIVDRVSEGSSSTAAPSASGPVLPAVGSLSNAWYCALGSSAPNTDAAETILVADLGGEGLRATVTVMPGSGGDAVSRDVRVPARGQVRVPVADVLATPAPGVVVETFGGRAVVEHQLDGDGDVAVGPCATRPSTEWYLGGGTTVRGTQLWLTLFNPFGDDAIVDLSFFTDGGYLAPGDLQGVVVTRRSRVDIPIHDAVRGQAVVATQVAARTGRVVAEQALVREIAPKGLAVSLGAARLASQWTFPVASVGGSSSITVANPAPTPARVTVAVHLDGDATLAPQVVVVPGRAAVSVDVGGRIPANLGAWVSVDSGDTPVAAEQVLALAQQGIATSPGSPDASRRWALASPGPVGAPGVGATDSVVVVNPGRAPVTVVVHLLHDGRDERATAVRIPPGRRHATDLTAVATRLASGQDAAAPGSAGSAGGVVVDASGPVVAAGLSSGPAGLTVGPAVPAAAATVGS